MSAESQRIVCARFGSPFEPPTRGSTMGAALTTLSGLPLNALRHRAQGAVSGWYIWGGKAFSQAPDFFKPLHVVHADDCCPSLLPYLALAPGWRVLLGPGYEDVWFDRKLLDLA